MISADTLNLALHALHDSLATRVPNLAPLQIDEISPSKAIGTHAFVSARLLVTGKLHGLIALVLSEEVATKLGEGIVQEVSADTLSDKARSAVETSLNEALTQIGGSLTQSGVIADATLLPILTDLPVLLNLSNNSPTIEVCIRLAVDTPPLEPTSTASATRVNWPAFHFFVSLEE